MDINPEESVAPPAQWPVAPMAAGHQINPDENLIQEVVTPAQYMLQHVVIYQATDGLPIRAIIKILSCLEDEEEPTSGDGNREYDYSNSRALANVCRVNRTWGSIAQRKLYKNVFLTHPNTILKFAESCELKSPMLWASLGKMVVSFGIKTWPLMGLNPQWLYLIRAIMFHCTNVEDIMVQTSTQDKTFGLFVKMWECPYIGDRDITNTFQRFKSLRIRGDGLVDSLFTFPRRFHSRIERLELSNGGSGAVRRLLGYIPSMTSLSVLFGTVKHLQISHMLAPSSELVQLFSKFTNLKSLDVMGEWITVPMSILPGCATHTEEFNQYLGDQGLGLTSLALDAPVEWVCADLLTTITPPKLSNLRHMFRLRDLKIRLQLSVDLPEFGGVYIVPLCARYFFEGLPYNLVNLTISFETNTWLRPRYFNNDTGLIYYCLVRELFRAIAGYLGWGANNLLPRLETVHFQALGRFAAVRRCHDALVFTGGRHGFYEILMLIEMVLPKHTRVKFSWDLSGEVQEEEEED